MSDTYAAWWPILDDDATFADLTAEATPELHALTDAADLAITGPIRWATDERDAGLVLLALAPVSTLDAHEPDDLPHIDTKHRASAYVAEDVEFLLDHDPALTARLVAERLKLTTSGVYKALGRAGRDDLRDRLMRNTSWTDGAPLRQSSAASRRSA